MSDDVGRRYLTSHSQRSTTHGLDFMSRLGERNGAARVSGQSARLRGAQSNISNCATFYVVLASSVFRDVSISHSSREACEIAADVFFVCNAIPLEIKFSAAVGLTLAVVITAACLTFQFVELPGIR